jgi:Arc/MetJ-type ribon-helix-helix transcriptional regulator
LGGDYASTAEVVREALRDWKMKRALQLQELAESEEGFDSNGCTRRESLQSGMNFPDGL